MEAKNARFSGDKAVAERIKGVVPAGCRTVNRAPRNRNPGGYLYEYSKALDFRYERDIAQATL